MTWSTQMRFGSGCKASPSCPGLLGSDCAVPKFPNCTRAALDWGIGALSRPQFPTPSACPACRGDFRPSQSPNSPNCSEPRPIWGIGDIVPCYSARRCSAPRCSARRCSAPRCSARRWARPEGGRGPCTRRDSSSPQTGASSARCDSADASSAGATPPMRAPPKPPTTPRPGRLSLQIQGMPGIPQRGRGALLGRPSSCLPPSGHTTRWPSSPGMTTLGQLSTPPFATHRPGCQSAVASSVDSANPGISSSGSESGRISSS